MLEITRFIRIVLLRDLESKTYKQSDAPDGRTGQHSNLELSKYPHFYEGLMHILGSL